MQIHLGKSYTSTTLIINLIKKNIKPSTTANAEKSKLFFRNRTFFIRYAYLLLKNMTGIGLLVMYWIKVNNIISIYD